MGFGGAKPPGMTVIRATTDGSVAAMRPAPGQTRFSVGTVFASWLAAFLAANIVIAAIASAAGHGGEDADTWPMWLAVTSFLVQWVPYVIVLVLLSKRDATDRFIDDYRLRFRWVDLLGFPIGVLCQLVLLQLVYWPLRELFPDTFTDDRLEERAGDLWDRAHGFWLVALVVVVAIGAPIVEELIYRGLILQTLQSRIDDVLALVISAAFFAGIHFAPVEFPGLFAFAIVAGLCFQRTGRLPMAITTHIGFNAVGLALAASR
jgi:membrane protease YdiL (CAAX protease family)